ncbi:MAG: DUF5752 family protein [Thermodesulfobacteriota bacterium]
MSDVFQFLSSASMEKLTGQKAESLNGLLTLIKTCPDTSLFYHTFSAYMKMREIRLPYNNDFTFWISNSLNEKALAEKIMAIDLAEYHTIKNLRTRLIEIIEEYRHQEARAFRKRADDPFFLYDIIRIVYLTDKFAYDLTSFREVLATISIYSIYFHFIECRLEKDLCADDFSTWIEYSLNLPDLAQKINKIDLDGYTMEELRTRIIRVIDEYSKEL